MAQQLTPDLIQQMIQSAITQSTTHLQEAHRQEMDLRDQQYVQWMEENDLRHKMEIETLSMRRHSFNSNSNFYVAEAKYLENGTECPYTFETGNINYHQNLSEYLPYGKNSVRNYLSSQIKSAELPTLTPESGYNGDFQNALNLLIGNNLKLMDIINGDELEPTRVPNEPESHFQDRTLIFVDRTKAIHQLLSRTIAKNVENGKLHIEWTTIANSLKGAMELYTYITKRSSVDSVLHSIKNLKILLKIEQVHDDDDVHAAKWKSAYEQFKKVHKDCELNSLTKNTLFTASFSVTRHRQAIVKLSSIKLDDFSKLSVNEILQHFLTNSLTNQALTDSRLSTKKALLALADNSEDENEGIELSRDEQLEAIALYVNNKRQKLTNSKLTGTHSPQDPSKVTCYQCGHLGHYRSNCTTPSDKYLEGYPAQPGHYGVAKPAGNWRKPGHNQQRQALMTTGTSVESTGLI